MVESLLSKGILGLDFLIGQDCKLVLAQCRLELPSQKLTLPLVSTASSSSCMGVKLVATASLPPHSKMEVVAETTECAGDDTIWLLEEKPAPSKHSPIMVARAVVTPKNGKIVVRLLNPRPETVTWHANSTIAELMKLDAVSVVSLETSQPVEKECNAAKKRMLLDSCNAELTPDQRQQFYGLLLQCSDIFSEDDGDLGRTGMLQHGISTGDAQPIQQGMRRIPPA